MFKALSYHYLRNNQISYCFSTYHVNTESNNIKYNFTLKLIYI